MNLHRDTSVLTLIHPAGQGHYTRYSIIKDRRDSGSPYNDVYSTNICLSARDKLTDVFRNCQRRG